MVVKNRDREKRMDEIPYEKKQAVLRNTTQNHLCRKEVQEEVPVSDRGFMQPST